jgi:AbiJ N-terminal domain 4
MIFETFARRKRQQSRNGEPEIYIYDQAPGHMRYQIGEALSEGIGPFHRSSGYAVHGARNANDIWEQIDRICRKEIHSYLSYCEKKDLSARFLNYILQVEDVEDFLSAVEIGCVGLRTISDIYPFDEPSYRGAQQKVVDAIEEINARFEEHSVGYQFENGQIIRVDSKVTHAEIIKPALILLTAPAFSKANEDFMTAHRHYRANEFKDCVTAANRAFESMLKAICDTEKWEYGKGDRAAELVTKVTNKGLFTRYFDRSLDSYVAMLKAGLPAVRNDAGSHGEGLAAAAVTAGIARFAINLTATNLVFLGDSYSAMKSGQRRR